MARNKKQVTEQDNEKIATEATSDAAERRALFCITSVEDASKPLRFIIDPVHIESGACGDPQKCVIAQSLLDAVPLLSDVEVGSTITKVVIGDKCVRYMTPPRLRAALRVFDVTGKWNLPPGVYVLPIPRSGYKLNDNESEDRREKQRQRWKKWKQEFDAKEGGENAEPGKGINVFKSRPLLTRRVAILKEIPLNE